jgi:hypothetical protein
MKQFIVVADGTRLSAAMWIWVLSLEDAVVLREVPKESLRAESHRIEFFSGGETFESTDGRRFWPVHIDEVTQQPRAPRQGKPVAQWKREKQGWRK